MRRETLSESAISLPRQIGPYRLESRLGIGGMGEVYRAWDQRLERWVAVKQILAQESSDPRNRERLRREARTVASLSHASIVQIHDILESDLEDWIVMEMVEGQTLHTMLQEGPLQVSQALYLALEVIEGLAEAHEKGIVHRDLKTENVMVTPAGHAKILDFGLAKRLWPDDSDASLSVQGTILGTGRAMSPEQVLGEDIDHRSDLFSFGTLLFEMTTGERPFVGSSLVLTLAQVCSETHPPAREINADLPDDLSDLIDHLLEKEPDQRPQTAREVATLLSDIAGIPLPEPRSNPEPSRLRYEAAPTQPASTFSDLPVLTEPLAPSGRRATHESSSGISIKTLVEIRLVDLGVIHQQLGDSDHFDLLSRHDRLTRDLLGRFEGLEVERFADGFGLLFERPLDAVRFGVTYHEELATLSKVAEVELLARVGIHLGEIRLWDTLDRDREVGQSYDLEGPARETVERLTALARPGQTLVSQEATHIAQRAFESLDDDTASETSLGWENHGYYDFDDGHETLEIFAVLRRNAEPLAAPDDPAIAQRLPAGPWTPGRSPTWWGLAMVALVAVTLGALTVSAWWLGRPSRGDSSQALRPSVAVLGFENLGREEDRWMATSIAELINSHLQAGSALRLIPRQSVARASLELDLTAAETLADDTLAAIRRNLGNDFLVLGSLVVLPQDDDHRLSLQVYLQDTRDPQSVESWTFEGRSSMLLELGLDAGRALRERLGVSTDPPADQVATRSALPESQDAAALYFRGLDALRTFDASSARLTLERSTELDPEFALAHAALSLTWRYLGYDTKALESASRAYELSEGLPRAEALWIAGHYHEAKADWDQAISAFQTLAGFFPQNVDYGLLLAEAQVAAGRGQDAMTSLAVLRDLPAPLNEDPRLDLATVEANLVLGRYNEALGAARSAWAKAEPRQAWVLGAEARRLEGVALFQLGLYPEARVAYAEAQRLFSDADDLGKAAQVMNNIANLLVHEGRMDEAELLYHTAIEQHRQIGSRKWLADVQNGLAFSMQVQGDLEGATSLLEDTLELVREAGDRQRETIYLDTLAWVLLQQGRWSEAETRARENLELSDRQGIAERAAWAHYYLGQVAFVGGQLEDASKHYAQALAISETIEYEGVAGYALRGQVEVLIYRGRLEEAQDRLADYRIAGAVFGEDVEALTQQMRARLAIELGTPAEAVDLADLAYQDLAAAGRRDEAAAAGVVVVRALIEQQRFADGRRRLQALESMARDSLNPRVRLRYLLARACLELGEGDRDRARQLFGSVAEDAGRLGLMPTQLEARWALSGLEEDPAGARDLAEEAEALGFGFIRRQIEAQTPTTRPVAGR